ncbi:hypothetical protein QJS04_geneDACA011713 [Acorus gramineus]|uniref:Uncharacterized protein n=1 Tax=Acorus gramineus TaxID=55184 RepID=A0AAV9BEF3_ACOGR|nr:hypothetical protein QJS04_geneDACA011713 [Acorus gramineus]
MHAGVPSIPTIFFASRTIGQHPRVSPPCPHSLGKKTLSVRSVHQQSSQKRIHEPSPMDHLNPSTNCSQRQKKPLLIEDQLASIVGTISPDMLGFPWRSLISFTHAASGFATQFQDHFDNRVLFMVSRCRRPTPPFEWRIHTLPQRTRKGAFESKEVTRQKNSLRMLSIC